MIKKSFYYIIIGILVIFDIAYFPAFKILSNYYSENPTERMKQTLLPVDNYGGYEARDVLFHIWSIIIILSLLPIIVELISKKILKKEFEIGKTYLIIHIASQIISLGLIILGTMFTLVS